MRKFEEGAWVITTMKEIGWIISNDDRGVRMFDVERGKVSHVQHKFLRCYEETLLTAKEDARQAFVDLALMTKDEEWFREVSG